MWIHQELSMPDLMVYLFDSFQNYKDEKDDMLWKIEQKQFFKAICVYHLMKFKRRIRLTFVSSAWNNFLHRQRIAF